MDSIMTVFPFVAMEKSRSKTSGLAGAVLHHLQITFSCTSLRCQIRKTSFSPPIGQTTMHVQGASWLLKGAVRARRKRSTPRTPKINDRTFHIWYCRTPSNSLTRRSLRRRWSSGGKMNFESLTVPHFLKVGTHKGTR
jgi:hypothetical protein